MKLIKYNNLPLIRLDVFIEREYKKHVENICRNDEDYQKGIIAGYEEYESLLKHYFEDCTSRQIGKVIYEYLYETKK